MGAHEVPVEHRSDRARYVDLVVDEMIPAVAAAGLAEWCDVFCETGVFTADESRRILEAGQRAGLKAAHPRRRARRERRVAGGRRRRRAIRRSPHLRAARRHCGDVAGGCRRHAAADGGVLPQARALRAGARLIDAGVAVALATDVNPGGGFSPSMPFAMTLACFAMGLTFEEALTAATINAAWSLDRAHEVGSLEPGKLADAVIVRGDATDLLQVSTGGSSAIAGVLKRGTFVTGEMVTA